MPITEQDEIVESRTWSSGTEMISHVNWSHIARVRRVLGTTGFEFHRNQFEQPVESTRPTLRLERAWSSAGPRAA